MTNKNKTVWSSRFKSSTSKSFQRIGASINVDKRLYEQDIFASKIHTQMLIKKKIIPNNEFTDRILTPRSPIQLIEGEPAYASVNTQLPCTLVINTSNDLTNPEPIEIEVPAGITTIPILRFSDTNQEMCILNGNIGCKGKTTEKSYHKQSRSRVAISRGRSGKDNLVLKLL